MAAQPFPVPAPPPTLRLLDAPPAPPSREPEWVGRSWTAVRREMVRYGRTAIAFGLRPRETARLWAEGRFDALNPLAYLLNSIAVYGPWRALWQWILHTRDMPLWVDVLVAVSPFLMVVAGTGTNHLVFRLFGSKRRFTSSIAISIYSTGGLPIVLGLIVTPSTLLTAQLRTPQAMLAAWPHYALTYGAIAIGWIWPVLAMAGLHGVSARRSMLLQALGTAIVGVACLVLLAEIVMWLIFAGAFIHH